jgi:hypothetical protein
MRDSRAKAGRDGSAEAIEAMTGPLRGLLLEAWSCDNGFEESPAKKWLQGKAPRKGLHEERARAASEPRGDCVEIPIANAG